MKKKILIVTGVFALIILAGALDGFIFMNLWNWFIHPIGLIRLNFWHALGVSLFLDLILLSVAKVDAGKDLTENICHIVAKLVIELALFGVAALISLII